MRIGIVSDTHDKMNPAVFDLFAGVDYIFHAGDIGNEDIIISLQALAPVFAVYGNTDTFAVCEQYPQYQAPEIAGRTILMTHILPHLTKEHLETIWREQAGLEKPPGVFIYGHTHQDHIERVGSILTINPGAAGPPRFRLKPSVAFLEIDAAGGTKAWAHKINSSG